MSPPDISGRILRRDPVQVVAVSGGKGGVGKSTLSINLAIASAAAGRRVVLLDGPVEVALLFAFRFDDCRPLRLWSKYGFHLQQGRSSTSVLLGLS